MSEKTIEEFLTERIDEIERAYPASISQDLIAHCRDIIEWHKNWPILVETKPTVTFDQNDVDELIYQMTQQITWLTQEEYRKKFGSEPPTAPLLRKMAARYSWHEDYNEDWSL